jgi:hypothetical protein
VFSQTLSSVPSHYSKAKKQVCINPFQFWSVPRNYMMWIGHIFSLLDFHAVL